MNAEAIAWLWLGLFYVSITLNCILGIALVYERKRVKLWQSDRDWWKDRAMSNTASFDETNP